MQIDALRGDSYHSAASKTLITVLGIVIGDVLSASAALLRPVHGPVGLPGCPGDDSSFAEMAPTRLFMRTYAVVRIGLPWSVSTTRHVDRSAVLNDQGADVQLKMGYRGILLRAVRL